MATATDISILEAQKREPGTKNAARRVRAGGKIPAVVYGAGKSAAAIAVDPRQVLRILKSESGHNTIFDLALDSDRVKAMIVDWQFEPIKGNLLHVDLQRIAMDQELTVTVPIVLKGEAEGVKTEGGILEQLLREIEIECLPVDIPKNIEVDISHLVFGIEVRVKDLPHNPKLKFLTDENQMIAHITTVKEEVVAAPEVVAAEAAAPAEPEVIKKGKQEVEGEVEAEGDAKAKAKTEKAEKAEKAEKKEKK
ncbi:MAG: 50S ribosomal protein L25 [Acidobacteriia bacterium]|nr:50S ribosomal protein L25 [Terriglobia bacterium]